MPMLFLNQFFQFAALNKYAEYLEANPAKEQHCNCAMPMNEMMPVLQAEEIAGRNPLVVCTHTIGHVIVHDFGKDDPLEVEDDDGSITRRDGGMRMVCWSQVGPAEYNKEATQWWRHNNAAHRKGSMLDKVSRLHESVDTVYKDVDDDTDALLRNTLNSEGMIDE
jgi:hypothetical protein